MFWVRVADDRYRTAAHALCGAVSCFGVTVCAIYFHEHGIIDARAKCAFHGVEINSVSVSSQLNPMSQARRQIIHQCEGAFRAAVSYKPRDSQLGIRIDGNPSPHIPVTELLLLIGRHVFLLGVDEAPNLVALNTLASEVP